MEEREIVQLAARTAVEQYKVDTGKLFTIGQAADQLGVSRGTIYNKMKIGEIDSVDVFGQKRFSMDAIERCKVRRKSW